MGSRMIAAVIVVMLFGAPAFAQGCGAGTCSLQASPAVGMGSLRVEPTIRDIPENMQLRPGDTVIWEIGTGSHGVLFKEFGPHNMLNFTDIQKIFEVDAAQFTSIADPSRVETPRKNRPGDVLLRLTVKADALSEGIHDVPFASAAHEDAMSAVLRLSKSPRNANEQPREFRVKAAPQGPLVWVLSDGQQEIVLPRLGGAAATAGPACCCGQMAGGGCGTMSGMSRINPTQGTAGNTMPGMPGMSGSQGMGAGGTMPGGMPGMGQGQGMRGTDQRQGMMSMMGGMCGMGRMHHGAPSGGGMRGGMCSMGTAGAGMCPVPGAQQPKP